jgi:hypothetical protein
MTNFINSSALTKLLANLFIFVVLVAAVGIAMYDTINNLAVSSYITGLIGGGMTYAVGILGVHIGGVQALQSQQSNADQLLTAANVSPSPPTSDVDTQVTAKSPVVSPPISLPTR